MKKQASIILAALLAVSLTACSGGKTETPATTAAGETSAATEAASTAGGDNTAVSPDNDFVIALQADATHRIRMFPETAFPTRSQTPCMRH